MAKSAEAFRTIGEVSTELGVPKHVLRFWEAKFKQLKPMKRGGNRRFYRPEDVELLRGIKTLLHRDAYTIRGAQRVLRDQGVEWVKAMGQPTGAAPAAEATAIAGPAVASEPPAAHGRTASRAPKATPAAKPRRGQPRAGADRRAALEVAIQELIACRALLTGGAPDMLGSPVTRGDRAAG